MRFKSQTAGGLQVFAVSGVNTISFGIKATESAKKGLLGFSVTRFDPTEDERYTMPGFKVFKSIIPHPKPGQQVSTSDHPIQSFLWDDFTGKPGRAYEYTFLPLRGKPKNLDRSGTPVTIRVRTEPLFTKDNHDVFFNRGVASSQAYAWRFGNLPPEKLEPPSKEREALAWLTRDLDEAIIKFIESAGPKDSLLCAFYEFRYAPVLMALEAARKRIHSLKIIVDVKVNDGNFPRKENLKSIEAIGFPESVIIKRDHNPSDIQHNKFMVLLKGTKQTPTEVWTGSTNISLGGFTGQTNVGHWVRDSKTAVQFKKYWDLLATNPGSRKTDDRALSIKKKKAYRQAVESLMKVPVKRKDIPKGTTAIFSPRSGLDVLNMYVELVDKAESLSCITLAFGINDVFKNQLKDNTFKDHITFLLLEQRDRPRENSKTAFIALDSRNNVYEAWGSYIEDPVYQWAKETNARLLQLNTHVSYIHSKFLLRDPLGLDPIVVTGSANFSEASTNGNDENMIIVRGNTRVADIYFTEFNRLFNHYYFRSVMQTAPKQPGDPDLFLCEKPQDWLPKYAAGKLKAKRLNVYTEMEGFGS